MDTDIIIFDMAKTPHPEELSFLPGASHPLLDRVPLQALVLPPLSYQECS